MEALKYENLTRSLFQTGRNDDPLGVLAEASEWDELFFDEFTAKNQARVWFLLCRLRNSYLDGNEKHKANFSTTYEYEDKIWNSKSNEELVDILEWIFSVSEELQLSEFPHISYRPTNLK